MSAVSIASLPPEAKLTRSKRRGRKLLPSARILSGEVEPLSPDNLEPESLAHVLEVVGAQTQGMRNGLVDRMMRHPSAVVAETRLAGVDDSNQFDIFQSRINSCVVLAE